MEDDYYVTTVRAQATAHLIYAIPVTFESFMDGVKITGSGNLACKLFVRAHTLRRLENDGANSTSERKLPEEILDIIEISLKHEIVREAMYILATKKFESTSMLKVTKALKQ